MAAVRIVGDGAEAEPIAGGAIQFLFNKTDNSDYAISFNGNTLVSSDFWYEVDDKTNLFDLWGQMGYAEQDVSDYDTPFFQKDKAPSLGLRFESDGEFYNTGALTGSYSWSYDNSDGTTTHINSDSAHPLDSFGEQSERIEMREDMSEINLIFSMPPDSFTVRRWSDKYLGDAKTNEQNYESISVSGNAIPLSDDGNGYIYEVHATWPQGDVRYSFYIK